MNLEDLSFYLVSQGEREEALSLLSTMSKHAWQWEEYDSLAKSYFKIKEYKKSIEEGKKALITSYTSERLWVTRNNLINVYNHANQPEEALKLIALCERMLPGDVDILLEKAFSSFLMNKKDEAEEILLSVLNDQSRKLPEEMKTRILFNLGTYALYRDEFQKGMRLFLLEGKKLDFWQKATLPFKFWEGGIMPGRTIILFAEAGIGDEFINVRFMTHLKNLGMKPIWMTSRKEMVEIFKRNGFESISSLKEIRKMNLKDEPLWTYPMSLPVYLNLSYKDLWSGPYLKANPFFIEKWKWVGEKEGLKIGLRWAGNPDYDQDLHRTIPLKDIVPLIEYKSLFSLQRDNDLEALEGFPNVLNLSTLLKSFEDTLAVIHHLDVVITSDTSIAHAAASMGKRTFIFTPISAYYLYCNSFKYITPWYGENVTVLRQITPRSWDEPIEALKSFLLRDI